MQIFLCVSGWLVSRAHYYNINAVHTYSKSIHSYLFTALAGHSIDTSTTCGGQRGSPFQQYLAHCCSLGCLFPELKDWQRALGFSPHMPAPLVSVLLVSLFSCGTLPSSAWLPLHTRA